MIFDKTPIVPNFGDSVQAAKSLALNRKATLCAALIIAVGAALRLWALGELPPGVNQDEASGAYEAWALLHYGIDRNGHSWPVHFVAYGSGLNALLPYAAMPFIWIGGLDIAAYRLPMALMGIASLWLVWRIAHNAAGPKFALIALLLLALSPWHIMANRLGWDANTLPFPILLSAYFLSRHDRHRFGVQALAVAALSLSAYAYWTAYAFAPMFLAAAFGWLALNGALTLRRAFALSAIAAAVAAPVIVFLAVNMLDLDTTRVLGATIPRYPTTARYETQTLLFRGDWGGMLANIGDMSRLLLGYPEGGVLNFSALPGWGALPRFSAIIAAAGLGAVLHRAMARRDFGVHLLVAMWFVLALALAALADANLRRLNLAWLPALYLTALGLSALRLPRAALCAAIAAVAALGGVFAHQYFREYESAAASAFNKGLDAAISRAVETAGENELIYISRHINQPYMHALYAAAAPPRRHIETRVMDNLNRYLHQILAFDRFVFLSPFQRGAPSADAERARSRERRYRHLETAGVDASGIDHYIFKLPKEAADLDALDADRFIVERHGIFAYAYPKDGGDGSPGGGSIRVDTPLVQGEPDARAKFDLHIQDGELTYFKTPCDQYDARERFFLHIVPADISDIPEERRRHGFDNMDFWFGEYGALLGRQCLAHIPLPEYGIAAIETGQTERTREWPKFWRQSWKRLWTAELKF